MKDNLPVPSNTNAQSLLQRHCWHAHSHIETTTPPYIVITLPVPELGVDESDGVVIPLTEVQVMSKIY